MASVDFPWRAKIGISDEPKWRRKAVQDSISREVGRAVEIRQLLSARTCFAQPIETVLKRFTKPLQTATVPGDGGTEWRWVLNPLVCTLLLIIGYGFSVPGFAAWAAFALLAPIPFDLLLIVRLITLIDYALVLAAGVLVWYFAF